MSEPPFHQALLAAFQPMAPPPAFEEELLVRLEDQLASRRELDQLDHNHGNTILLDLEQVEDHRHGRLRSHFRASLVVAAIALLMSGAIWVNIGFDGQGITAEVTAVQNAIQEIDSACAATLPALGAWPTSIDEEFGVYSVAEELIQDLRQLVDGLRPAMAEARRHQQLSEATDGWRLLVTDLETVERLFAAGDFAFASNRLPALSLSVERTLELLEREGAKACRWQ